MSNFNQLIGQSQAIALLQAAMTTNRLAPAYLFVGVSGIGKALAAKYFAQQLLTLHLPDAQKIQAEKRIFEGNHPDLFWVQPTYQHQGKYLTAKEAEAAGLKRKAPPQIRIEQIREITHFLSRPALEASRCLVILEEAQTMAEGAANALLKTLEEPGKATLILIAPSLDSLLPTLVSRCQKIPFYRLSETEMEQVLKQQNQTEILAYPEIIALAQGSPGKALEACQQLQSISENLRTQLLQLPNRSLKVLAIAKTIDQELDNEAQLWLVDYLQYCYWEKRREKALLEALEKARQYLLSYVQPRLVWECTLLAICRL